MRVYIVDDEQHARENLKRKIQLLDIEVEFCGEVGNVDEAMTDLASLQIDLLFLDIEMPGEDGFALLERFESLPFMVIFVTAYNDFALKAFEYFTLGFVTKPIDIDLLKKAVDKAFSYKGEQEEKVLDAVKNIRDREIDKIVVPSAKGFTLLPSRDVVLMESGDGYTSIYCSDGGTVLSTKRLKEYEEALGESSFLRVHRSYLINCHHIVDYKKDGTILLTGDQTVTINKNNRKSVADSIRAFFAAKKTS